MCFINSEIFVTKFSSHNFRRKITTNIWNTQGFDDKNRIYLHF